MKFSKSAKLIEGTFIGAEALLYAAIVASLIALGRDCGALAEQQAESVRALRQRVASDQIERQPLRNR